METRAYCTLYDIYKQNPYALNVDIAISMQLKENTFMYNNRCNHI